MVHHSPIATSNDLLHMITPSHTRKVSRSDAHFPLSTPRRHRAPSITETMLEGQGKSTSTTQKLSVRVRAPSYRDEEDVPKASEQNAGGTEPSGGKKLSQRHGKTLDDLPLEIQGLILDHLFGDLHSVASTSPSPQSGANRLSSAMRHPRRKALTDVALVSPTWRELVQERIYRHIKIKGNRTGLVDSTEWFSENLHLTQHVRHIEFWVPVWADKPPDRQQPRFIDAPMSVVPTPSFTSFHGHGLPSSPALGIDNQTHNLTRHTAGNNDDEYPSFTYPFSSGSTSATLSEIFSHVACFFSLAQIFSLEGGHCRKSNMIRQFPAALFPTPHRRLEVLPNIRTFAMRGAWNIMREYEHWKVIERALPGLQEWHCSYAKPRPEAYATISSILSHLPTKMTHVNICLDGFYCKDGIEGSGMLASSPQTQPLAHHLCERLGRIAPQLESLSFTGRICDGFFRAATEAARVRKGVSQLRAVDIVVKSCCRLVVVKKALAQDEHGGDGINTENEDEDEDDDDAVEVLTASSNSYPTTTRPIPTAPTTPTTTSQTLSPSFERHRHHHHHHHHHHHISTITGSITHLPFILSFERLILSAVRSLDPSSFPALSHMRIRFIDLDSACPLLNPYFVFDGPRDGRCSGVWNEEIVAALRVSRPGSVGWEGLEEDREEDGMEDASAKAAGLRSHLGSEGLGFAVLRRKPRAIRSSAYRVLADAR